MDLNDSPEIPDRGETSDIPGLPSGGSTTKVILGCIQINEVRSASPRFTVGDTRPLIKSMNRGSRNQNGEYLAVGRASTAGPKSVSTSSVIPPRDELTHTHMTKCVSFFNQSLRPFVVVLLLLMFFSIILWHCC